MLVVLGLIDVVMISNLLIMVIVGGYETFVSRMELEGHRDQPEWRPRRFKGQPNNHSLRGGPGRSARAPSQGRRSDAGGLLRRQDDRVRAQFSGREHRHCRADAELAGDVAAGRYDSALATADN